LTAALNRVAVKFPQLLSYPRGIGLMQACDVLDAAGISPSRRGQIIQAAFRRGLLLLGCGQAGIRFCPALCVAAEEVAAAIDIFAAACAEIAGE
jgi:4-aminobutyrate aminotransferase